MPGIKHQGVGPFPYRSYFEHVHVDDDFFFSSLRPALPHLPSSTMSTTVRAVPEVASTSTHNAVPDALVSPGEETARNSTYEGKTISTSEGTSHHGAEEVEAEDTTEYPTGIKFTLICVALAAMVFLVALDQTIVSTAVPRITAEFNSFQDVGFYSSAYLMTSTAFQPLFGKFYGSFSVKWTFLAAFLIFELGSLICAVANSSNTFIAGRAIAGLGLAGAYSGALIIITLIAPLHIRPLLTSGISGMYGVGATIGPIIGGAITSVPANNDNSTSASYRGWRWNVSGGSPVDAAKSPQLTHPSLP